MVFLVRLVAAEMGRRKTTVVKPPTNSLSSHAITFKTDPNYPLT